jgi:LPS-assembly protein
VSDNTFFADLSRSADSATRTNLPTELWARYQANWGEINTRASHYQTLQDVTNSIVPTYERLPVVNIQLRPVVWQNLGGLTFDFNAQAARYKHPTLTQGSRVYAVPQLSHAWLPNWGFIKSKVQLNMVHYAGLNGISYTNTDRFSRAIPIASLDTGLIFERKTAWFSKVATQTLEPRLYFVYAPFKDQSTVPVFDSALSSFSLAQIFSDNVFTGQDRIANARHITPALTTEWLDPNTGTTLFKATIGKRYYFEPQRITLTGPSLPANTSGGNTVASSDWLIAAVGQPLTSLYIDAALQYDQTNREVVNSAYSVQYKPASRKLLSLSRRFTKDIQDAFDIAWQWRMAANHAVLGKLAYSLGVPSINLNRGLTESLLGYEYDAGCWVFRIAMNRYVNTANVKATSFYFQLDLSGLTQVSSGSLDTLKKAIPGYTPFEGTPTWTYDAFRSF